MLLCLSGDFGVTSRRLVWIRFGCVRLAACHDTDGPMVVYKYTYIVHKYTCILDLMLLHVFSSPMF